MNKITFASNRHYSLKFAAPIVLGMAIFLNGSTSVLAQTTAVSGDVLSTEGIVGDIDKGRRAPIVTFSTSVASDGSSATILLDTQVINEDFKKYPISVDFFVNGKLFSKQFRSIELPAPLGIVVPKELAPVPFNYSIVATLLHPNRQYVTIAQGAVTGSTSSSALECTATETLSGDSVGVDVTGAAKNNLGSDNSLAFTLTQDNSSAQVALTVVPSASSTSAETSGTVIFQQGDSAATTYEVKGSAIASGSVVSSVDISSTNGELVLKCDTVAAVSTPSTLPGDTSSSESSNLDNSNLAGVMNADPSSDSNSGSSDASGNANFVPLDEVDGVEVVN